MRIAHEPALLKRPNPNQARLLCHIETVLFQAEAIRTCLCFSGHKPLRLKEFLVNRPVTTKRTSKQPPAAGPNVRRSGFEKINRENGVVRAVGLEPTLPKDGDFKSPVSTIPPSARTLVVAFLAYTPDPRQHHVSS